MDKSQLVTIAVTAIITAFAKEIATWLSSIVKNLSTNSTIKAKIKSALTINKIMVVFNLALIAFFAREVYKVVVSPDPVDRFSAFLIAYYTCFAFLCFTRLETLMSLYTDKLIAARKRDTELIELQAILDKLKEATDSTRRAIEASKGDDEPPADPSSDRPK
jgi:hypothetical protein